MASYWKSNPRKQCEYCKCWIADNKASIEFHERGRSHQKKKEKFLNEVRKRSYRKQREEQNLDKYLSHMERAAAKQYQNDQCTLGLTAAPRLEVSRPMKKKHLLAPPPPADQPIKREKRRYEAPPANSGYESSKINHLSTRRFGEWEPVKVEEPIIEEQEELKEPVVPTSFESTKEEAVEILEKKHEVSVAGSSEEPVAFKKRKVVNRSSRKRIIEH